MPNDVQVPYAEGGFAAAEFFENPEPRCPCILLLDTSGSMNGTPIDELNKGLTDFAEELRSDAMAAKRVEIAVLTFGSQEYIGEFVTADQFNPPTLAASGATPMGKAIGRALDLLEKRKVLYNTHGVSYYRPWLFLITDGAPTDSWQAAAARIHNGEADKKFLFYAVGVGGADFTVLQQLAVRTPLKLQGVRFRDLFKWLSASLSSVSRSQPGANVALVNPTAPAGWASTA